MQPALTLPAVLGQRRIELVREGHPLSAVPAGGAETLPLLRRGSTAVYSTAVYSIAVYHSKLSVRQVRRSGEGPKFSFDVAHRLKRHLGYTLLAHLFQPSR